MDEFSLFICLLTIPTFGGIVIMSLYYLCYCNQIAYRIRLSACSRLEDVRMWQITALR